MKEAWRDPAGERVGLEGQATSEAIAGERVCLVQPSPRNCSSVFFLVLGDGVNPLLSSELRETPREGSRRPSQGWSRTTLPW